MESIGETPSIHNSIDLSMAIRKICIKKRLALLQTFTIGSNVDLAITCERRTIIYLEIDAIL